MYQLLPIHRTVTITDIATASEPIYDESFFFNGENHNFWEMVYVIDGAIGATADEKVIYLDRGEIIFHKPLEFHKLWAAKNKRPHLFIMSFRAEGPLMDYFRDGVFQLDEGAKAALENLLDYLRRNHIPARHEEHLTRSYLARWNQQKHYGEKVGALLTFFLLTVAESEKLSTGPAKSESARMYQKAVGVMREHLCANLSVSDIARLCGVSETYLKKLFLKYSSYSVHKYFVKMKILEAVSLLERGYSVLQISDRLTFSNQNYFSIVFKRETGCAPMIYKKRFLLP